MNNLKLFVRHCIPGMLSKLCLTEIVNKLTIDANVGWMLKDSIVKISGIWIPGMPIETICCVIMTAY